MIQGRDALGRPVPRTVRDERLDVGIGHLAQVHAVSCVGQGTAVSDVRPSRHRTLPTRLESPAQEVKQGRAESGQGREAQERRWRQGILARRYVQPRREGCRERDEKARPAACFFSVPVTVDSPDHDEPSSADECKECGAQERSAEKDVGQAAQVPRDHEQHGHSQQQQRAQDHERVNRKRDAVSLHNLHVTMERVYLDHRVLEHYQPAQQGKGQCEQNHFHRREKEPKRCSQQVQVGCDAS